jgi:hypothetical protein
MEVKEKENQTLAPEGVFGRVSGADVPNCPQKSRRIKLCTKDDCYCRYSVPNYYPRYKGKQYYHIECKKRLANGGKKSCVWQSIEEVM